MTAEFKRKENSEEPKGIGRSNMSIPVRVLVV